MPCWSGIQCKIQCRGYLLFLKLLKTLPAHLMITLSSSLSHKDYLFWVMYSYIYELTGSFLCLCFSLPLYKDGLKLCFKFHYKFHHKSNFTIMNSAVVSKLFLLLCSLLYLMRFIVNQAFIWVPESSWYNENQLNQWGLFYDKWVIYIW